MASIIKIELNLVPGAAPGGIMPRVRVSQGDAQDRILQFELYDGSEVADLTDVVSIFFGGQKPDGNGFTVLCTAQNNLITGILTPQSTVLAGLIPCKLYLTTATGSVRSATFDMQIDPDPLNDAGTSDTDITAIVAAAGNYAAEAHQSAEDAAASAETAATAGATAGQAAAEAVVAGKLDKVGGDSKDVVTTFTSQDNAADTGLITTTGQEVSVATMASGEKQSSFFNKATGLALNLRRTINAVKAIWTGVSDDWDPSGHSYSIYDMVWYGTHLYKCKLTHTSSESVTPLDTTYWEDTTITREITSLNTNYANLICKSLTLGDFFTSYNSNNIDAVQSKITVVEKIKFVELRIYVRNMSGSGFIQIGTARDKYKPKNIGGQGIWYDGIGAAYWTSIGTDGKFQVLRMGSSPSTETGCQISYFYDT